MIKLNSKTNKNMLISFLKDNGHKDEALTKESRKALLLMAREVQAKATAKAEKAAKKAAKTSARKAKSSARVKATGDGKRTSKPGALAHFRTLWTKGFSVDRSELIDQFVNKFGPKAKWAVLNYIGMAKAGTLKGCPTLHESEKVIGSGKPKKKGSRRAKKQSSKLATANA